MCFSVLNWTNESSVPAYHTSAFRDARDNGLDGPGFAPKETADNSPLLKTVFSEFCYQKYGPLGTTISNLIGKKTVKTILTCIENVPVILR